jgi:hypothetical protein
MMILEGIVTTKNADGSFNVAPMGPRVDDYITTLILRPFQTSQTYRNLKEHPYGVFHVTDDVQLLARAAIGSLNSLPETFPAETIEGSVLKSACRWYEFEIESFDDCEERTSLTASVVHSGRIRDFFGFNRAKHAVVEAAILATRLHLLPHQDILDQFTTLKVIVEKTAGPKESEAFDLLERYVHENDGNR